jgi:hypothetical protein
MWGWDIFWEYCIIVSVCYICLEVIAVILGCAFARRSAKKSLEPLSANGPTRLQQHDLQPRLTCSVIPIPHTDSNAVSAMSIDTVSNHMHTTNMERKDPPPTYEELFP